EAEPRRQLEVLSELYRRASVAVGTWGGISHLAPLHRRPTLGLFAEASANLALHIDAAERWMTRYEIPHRFARFADFDPDDVAAWVRDAIAQT
ncbi:MAG: hypothetical protein KDC38_16125, partial [Planctomycetes bacterium]|nr:hypothetical protein [Planctomycetota bacterium]